MDVKDTRCSMVSYSSSMSVPIILHTLLALEGLSKPQGQLEGLGKDIKTTSKRSKGAPEGKTDRQTDV